MPNKTTSPEKPERRTKPAHIVISLLLSVVLGLGGYFGTTQIMLGGWPPIGDTGLTRAGWIVQLYETATGTTPDPGVLEDIGGSYIDVPINAPDYHPIQFAANYQWMPEELTGYRFYPNETATRAFVAATAVRAAGYIAAMGDGEELPNDIMKADDIYGAVMAFNLGLLDVDRSGNCRPDEPVSKDFAEKCAAFVRSQNASLSNIKEKTEITYGANVADNRDRYAGSIIYDDMLAASISLPSNEVDFAEGDIVIFPATDFYPAGVARRVVGITESSGISHIETEEPSLSDLFDDLDVQLAVNLADLDADFFMDDGADQVSGVPAEVKMALDRQDSVYTDDTFVMGMPLTAKEEQAAPIALNASSLGITTASGSVQTLATGGFLAASPLSIPKWLIDWEKRVSGSKNLKDTFSKKAGPLEFSFAITDAPAMYTIRYCDVIGYEIPLSIRCIINYEYMISASVSGEYENKFTIYGLSHKVKDYFSFRFGVTMDVKAEGMLAISASGSGSVTAGIGTDGFIMPQPTGNLTSPEMTGEATATLSVGFTIDLEMLGVDVFRAGVNLTFNAEAKAEVYTENTPWDYCIDMKLSSLSTAFVGVPPESIGKFEAMYKEQAGKIKEKAKEYVDKLDVRELTDMLNEYIDLRYLGFDWHDLVGAPVDKLREQIWKGVEAGIDGSANLFLVTTGKLKDNLYSTIVLDKTKLVDFHLEGKGLDRLVKVTQCTRQHDIFCEEPAQLHVDETLRLVVSYKKNETGEKFLLPYVLVHTEIISGADKIALDPVSGAVTGLKTGEAVIRLTRILLDDKGEKFLSEVKCEFTITVTGGKVLRFAPVAATVEVNEGYTPRLFAVDRDGKMEPVALSSPEVEVMVSHNMGDANYTVWLPEPGSGTVWAKWTDPAQPQGYATFTLTTKKQQENDSDEPDEPDDSEEPDDDDDDDDGNGKPPDTGTGGSSCFDPMPDGSIPPGIYKHSSRSDFMWIMGNGYFVMISVRTGSTAEEVQKQMLEYLEDYRQQGTFWYHGYYDTRDGNSFTGKLTAAVEQPVSAEITLSPDGSFTFKAGWLGGKPETYICFADSPDADLSHYPPPPPDSGTPEPSSGLTGRWKSVFAVDGYIEFSVDDQGRDIIEWSILGFGTVNARGPYEIRDDRIYITVESGAWAGESGDWGFWHEGDTIWMINQQDNNSYRRE